MENNRPSEDQRPAKAGTSDVMVAYLLAGLIAIWLLAYAFFAIRAWMGRT